MRREQTRPEPSLVRDPLRLFRAPIIETALVPNRFDLLALVLVLGAVASIAYGARASVEPIAALDLSPVTLDVYNLPAYGLRTVLRMFAAMAASLLFTFVYATLAARSRRAELVLIPLLDILQAVPILGFLTFTVVFFLRLFPGQVLGAELAAVFAIFTSQAWNMTFSFYQSLKNVPRDLDEVCRSFGITPWKRFWRLDVPFAMPGLVWNAMMSMSGGWFFVVASEAITVGDTSFRLPGIGSYVALAIEKKDLGAVGLALAAMFVIILLYDQLLFRPLVAWGDKFRFEQTESGPQPGSWVLGLFRRTRALRTLTRRLRSTLAPLTRLSLPPMAGVRVPARARQAASGTLGDWLFFGGVLALTLGVAWATSTYLARTLGWADVARAGWLSLLTGLRVLILIAVASLIWVPLGVLVGLRPGLAERAQPIAQILAAFPANLAFPAFVAPIIAFDLDPNIWLSPLMILGTQWYILFNVVAGASAFPGDLKEASRSFHVRGWRWWRTVILPGILPYYVTGAITASGGCWNASIVAEVASWGDTRLRAAGIGSYIADATEAGDFARVTLGIAAMCVFVTLVNRLIWRPLALYGERRFRFG